MKLTESQLETWHIDRARQSMLGTNIAPWVRSRGDHMRRLNNGVALRTSGTPATRWPSPGGDKSNRISNASARPARREGEADVPRVPSMSRPASKCEMVTVHHPDCTCQWCIAHLDERCSEPAVATVAENGNLRVCEECAINMRLEDFAVAYDDGRTGPLS